MERKAESASVASLSMQSKALRDVRNKGTNAKIALDARSLPQKRTVLYQKSTVHILNGLYFALYVDPPFYVLE
ncbi:hypothetical protein MTP04_21070 [Lysinibacillus sp. PLM2]|nr:hypothetical protein MTP04_21070 [Lysinibacillus sp. PLM2]